MKYKVIVTFAFGMLLTFGWAACKKAKPQLPSNKTEKQEAESDIDYLNQKLVEREDSLLTIYISNRKENFEKSGAGFWYRFIKKNDGPTIKNEQQVILSYKIFLLDGTFIDEMRQTLITVGKHEIFRGLDIALPIMKKGESAVFVFPWSLAYGMMGNGADIPGYSSVIVEVTTEN